MIFPYLLKFLIREDFVPIIVFGNKHEFFERLNLEVVQLPNFSFLLVQKLLK